ncbi:MAG: ATP-binding cassette domain-containing protein [Rhodospirillaceae bacterium]|jgi:ATP-binding cassette, subfamily C, bacterial LapB|nr:ATP-binding cassette domain-containing protein [Rhodospirillaceae bacterium]MBT5245319.1 ATP-binding cassette domain-containing protein [Rhodospirillaceae bacterium]MBT5561208.1 ATP-binding cassette domain-containing protein [Rhodospirillaceae bacterium]MBT6242744.1 ATP-binding cassette domain-containing protein [Rhodospirillaceae bacterium]MBT7137290.1 ATP-binding cassette domain-containing protein [Rhodospirillaceae bacterium]
MNELFRRLKLKPGLSLEIALASLFANILALATTLFVIQVLNRYVAHGIDATLTTLFTGVLLAIILEYAFRRLRMRLARAVSAGPDQAIASAGFNVLLKVRAGALERIPQGQRQQIMSASSSIEKAFGSGNIGAVFDVPFAFLFVGVLFFINPFLSGIVGFFAVAVFIYGTLSAARLQKDTRQLLSASGNSNALIRSATAEIDTVRAFNASSFLGKLWQQQLESVQGLRRAMETRQGGTQIIVQTATALMSVLIVTAGATMVVAGDLNVGAMIGANILGARALMPISRFAQLGATFAEARESLSILREFAKLPLESDSGSIKTKYLGGLEFKDVAFVFPGGATPLFESLSLSLKPGAILVISGSNGSGKTTLSRLITGIIEPVRGQILVDGLDLRQASPEWWRKQIVYLPQEPTLLNTSIRENLMTVNPEASAEHLAKAITAAGLVNYLDESPKGLETEITDNGRNLSLGIRRRLALARALLTDGMLVIFDEPTEGLDTEGVSCVYAAMKDLAKRGRTIIVVSHDPKIVKGAQVAIDLNVKPVPRVTERPRPVETVAKKEDLSS